MLTCDFSLFELDWLYSVADKHRLKNFLLVSLVFGLCTLATVRPSLVVLKGHLLFQEMRKLDGELTDSQEY